MPPIQLPEQSDVIVIGSGIMGATVGALLRNLDPSLRIQVYEATSGLSEESSDGWHNAGTGHAGICELSYTPNLRPDGTVDVSKAIEVFGQFEQSRQFWGFAVSRGQISNPREFIRQVPHVSFVSGSRQVEFLRARHAAMVGHPFFASMEFTEDPATILRWAPLLVEGRPEGPIAATRMEQGTDVNFGALARKLLNWLARQPGCGVATRNRVVGLRETAEGWAATVKNLASGENHTRTARFVFVGAGGGSLPLLQKSGMAESRGLGGFPIGGQWLVCTNPRVVGRHNAKVYGQALDAAPTMAVPHLDTREIDGARALLFGPFAAWTSRFLHKSGSWMDLPGSVKPDNLATLLRIGIHNLPLIRYLVQQGTQSMGDRMEVLRQFYPAAKAEDWKLVDAGIRVQAIKKTDGEAGIVHYGTEVITDARGRLAALLGASPGASVSVSIALDVISKCLPELLASRQGRERLSEMIPIYGGTDAGTALDKGRQATSSALELG
jgi:malate dehydrogenase (quinone)